MWEGASLAAGAPGVSRLDVVVEWLMIALLAFMPLAFGAVEAWSEEVVIAVACAMAVCLGLKLIVRRSARLAWSWAYVPVGLFLLLAVGQLLPLPAGWVAAVSPNTAATKAELLGDLPAADDVLKRLTLTFYPLATRHDLRLVLALTAVFVVALNVYRRPGQIKRLLGAVAIIGGCLAVLSLAQVLSGTDRIFWRVPSGFQVARSGTFIHHAHYGQFMNLSMGAAVGLLAVKFHERAGARAWTLPRILRFLREPEGWPLWGLVVMIVLGAASVFLALTRGGVLSMLVAGTVTALVVASRSALKGRGWVLLLLSLAVLIGTLYVAFDGLYGRLATRGALGRYQDRWQILRGLSLAVTRFPVVGTGLGTHEVVYPMFDRATVPALAAHAENEYAQVAEETGVAGLALVLAFTGIVGWNYVRCVRGVDVPIRSAALGLGFGLMAILIQSLSDFGQHVPANAALTAAFSGLLVRMGRMGGTRSRADDRREAWSPLARRAIGAAAVLSVLAVGTWALAGVDRARRGEACWEETLKAEDCLRDGQWPGTNADYAVLLTRAMAAVDCEPDNVLYRHWLNVYRWLSISRVRDPESGAPVMTPRAIGFVERIVGEFQETRALCPTFGATYCVLGQLEAFVLGRPAGAGHIRRGRALAPYDATACYVAGLLDAREGKIDDSLRNCERALRLDGRLMGQVVDAYARQLKRPDLAVAIAKRDPQWLLRVAGMLSEKPETRPFAVQAKAEAVALLKERCRQPDPPAWALASVGDSFYENADYLAAIEYFRRALALEYGQVDWRLNLANSLARTGQIDEAIHESRICLRLRPRLAAAEYLLTDLKAHRGTGPLEE